MVTPEEEDGIEIIDFTGESLSLINIRCSTIIIIIGIMALIGYFTILDLSLFPLALLLVLGIVLIVVFYLSNTSSTRGMLRKFSISKLGIEFFLPNRDQFIIYWRDFNKINVTLKILDVKPFNIYNIKFIGGIREKSINVGLQDFNKEKIQEILYNLKSYAKIHKKQFKATKEKIVSGIFLVEDLEI